jgi:hypothetical protein
MNRRHGHIAGALWLPLLLLPACNFEGAEPVLPDNACQTSAECPEGAICRDNICVTGEQIDLAVALEITPVRSESREEAPGGQSPSNTDPGPAADTVTMVEPPRRITGPTVLAKPIEIPLLVEVSGNVRNGEELVAAKISFIPVDQIEGVQSNPITTNTSEEEEQYDSQDNPSDFIAWVLQNVEYRVVVQPLQSAGQGVEVSSTLPPIIISALEAEKRANRLDLEYADYSMTRRDYRVIGARAGQTMKIHAVKSSDPDRIISSTRIIVAEEGGTDFHLLFAPDQTGSYQLVFTPIATPTLPGGLDPGPGDEPDPPVYPVFRIDESELKQRADALQLLDPNLSGGTERLTVAIPAVPEPVIVSGEVRLCRRTEEDDADAGAPAPPAVSEEPESLPVVFRSSALFTEDGETPLPASFAVTTSASQNGTGEKLLFSTELFPGTYEVVVTPTAETDCGVYAREMTIAAPAPDALPLEHLFKVPGTTYIKGVLQTVGDEPIPGATVHAQALGRDGISENPTKVTRFNRTSQATTDEKGAFRMPVDLGSYDVIAKPPSGSGYAWRIMQDVDIGSRNREFFRRIDIESPVPLSGSLRFADSKYADTTPADLAGATIRAFVIVDDVADDTRPIYIGRTTADDEGNFTVLLSPEVDSGWY